ncbi:hypothetical protein ACFL3V_05395 [Nanoarchaeota archaeon]
MIDSKKAVSPLIAAVLLIVIVVGIGAVVTGIVRTKVTEDMQKMDKLATDVECSTLVQFNVPDYNSEYMICYGADYVNVTLENMGTVNIEEFQMKFFGSDSFATNDSFLTGGLGKGQIASQEIVYYSGSIGTLQEVYIIPKKKVTGTNNRIFCHEAQLKFNNVNPC